MSVVCIDAGMQWGGKAYLEITTNGKFITHQQEITADLGKTVIGGQWTRNDLNEQECG